MNTPDRGVPTLFQRATDDLRPDVEHLVSGGITRGRARRRRAQIGTAVATVAVFGVIGVAATVVPPNASPDSARDPGFATQSPTPTATATESPPESPESPPETLMAMPANPGATQADAPLRVAAADIPAAVDALLGTTLAGPPLTGARYALDEEDKSKAVSFLYDGMLTTVVIEPQSNPRAACQALDSCEEFIDGSFHGSWGPTVADGVTSQGGVAWRHGYEVSLTSYNSDAGIIASILAPEPPLDVDRLVEMAADPVWFEGLP